MLRIAAKDYNSKCPVCRSTVDPDTDFLVFEFDDVLPIADHLQKVHLLKLKHYQKNEISCMFEKYNKTQIIK